MQRMTIAFGLGCLLLAGCAADPATETAVRRDDAYIPTGSIIPRKDVKRSDVPAVTSAQQMTILRAGQTQTK